MPRTLLRNLFRLLRKECAAPGDQELSDGALVRRFLERRDEGAFEALLQRHGPMVLGVCRRVVGDAHAAEDAFQATFLVLARRAAAIRNQQSVGSWLFGVAQRIALQARAQAAARRDRERRAATMPRSEPLDELTWQELRAVLDEEVGRLPEKYRAAVVLCHLEGKTYEQAAGELGCPKSTLAKRVARAHELLRGQLTRRGLALSAGALATALTEKATAAPVGALLTLNLVNAMTSLAGGRGLPAGTLSTQAIALAEQAMKEMTATKMKLALVLLACCLVVGAAWAGYSGSGKADSGEGARRPKVPARPAQDKPGLDVNGDPLPPGAVARLGSSRFRQSSIIRALAFSPDSKTLAVSSQGVGSHTLRLLNAATGQEIRRFPAPKYEVSNLVFSPDGKLLVGTSGHDLHFWDVQTGAKRRDFTPHQDGATALALSHDGKTVALAVGSFSSDRHTIYLLDAATGKLLHELVGHNVRPRWLSFSADDKRLASGSRAGQYLFWDVSTGKSIRRIEGPNEALALSPDHRTLAVRRVRASPSIVVLRDVQSGKELGECAADLDDLLTFCRDGRLLATGGRREPIRIWDTATGRERSRLENSVGAAVEHMVFSPDGKRLACVGEWYRDGSLIRIWDVESGKELRPVAGHSGPLTCVACAPDSNTVATGSKDSTVRLWEADTGQQLHCCAGHTGKVTSVGFAPDGKLLASGGEDRTVRLWETATGRELRCLKGHEAPIVSASFMVGGRILLTADRKGVVKRWEVPGGKSGEAFGEKWAALQQVVCSPDGRYVARCGENAFREPALQVVRADNGKARMDVRHALPLAEQPFGRQRFVYWSASFSGNGRLLACTEGWQDDREGSAIFGSGIRLWEVVTGKEVLKIEEAAHVATAVAFSPDGKLLVSAHGHELAHLPYPQSDVFGGAAAPQDMPGLRFWDPATGKELGRLRGHLSWTGGVVFSPDGRKLISAGADHTALVWDVSALRRLQVGGVGK